MAGKSFSYELIWDFPIPKTLVQSQRWVLTAMRCHGDELVTMLWRILGNEQDVCDAYQNTFLQLAHCEDGFKPEHIKAYVFRSASNTAISMLRRRMVERKGLSVVGGVPSTAGSVTSEVDSRYLQQLLRFNIARLPEHLRNVVTLHDLAELSYQQVARILGITSATARVYRCKAIQLLAVWMNKDENYKNKK